MLAREFASVSPTTDVACDACQLIARVGRGRRLTARTNSRMVGAVATAERGDYGEHIPSLRMYLASLEWEAGFLPEGEALRLAKALGCGGPGRESRFKCAAQTVMLNVLGPMIPTRSS